MNRCEARIGIKLAAFGNEPILCNQSVGLRVVVAPDGSKHYACSRHQAKLRTWLARNVAVSR